MKRIIYSALCVFSISGITYARDTKTFGSVIEFSYDTTRHMSELDAFNEQINDNNANLVIVDFYASWCPPCKQLAPYLIAFAKEFPAVKFIKVDTDKYKQIPTVYHVKSKPQLLFFKNGNHKNTLVGFKDKATIKKTINEYLA